MSTAQWVIFVSAVAALCLGLLLALARRKVGAGPSRNRQVVAWMVLAICPVFLVFLFFPDSSVSGEFGWGQVGGAFGAFFVVWIYGVQRALKADTLTAAERDLSRRASEIAVAEARNAPVNPMLRGGDVDIYQLLRARKRQIGLVPGQIDDVRFADIWASSENTNMQMARFYDRSVSGIIRYLGSRRDGTGRVVEDQVADALAARRGGHETFAPGTVLESEPGQLATSHNVRRILHVAAVSGVFKYGYKPVDDLSACVEKAMECADRIADELPHVRSVLLPLFGAGTAGADPAQVAGTVIRALVDYFEGHPKGRITTAYVLINKELERACSRLALQTDERVEWSHTAQRKELLPA